MSRFPRAYRLQLEATDEANIRRATRDNEHLNVRQQAGATAPGDGRKLRGIPAIGRGVSGAIKDSRPGDSLR